MLKKNLLIVLPSVALNLKDKTEFLGLVDYEEGAWIWKRSQFDALKLFI